MGIPLQAAEPTGMLRRSLRRFTYTKDGPCPGDRLGHDASVHIEDVPGYNKMRGDDWPHDDPRWPAACEACGYAFRPADEWQRADSAIYRLPGGTEFAFWGSLGRCAPPGTMVRIPWFDEHSKVPGESWVVALPDGGDWITTQAASGGGHWTVTGTVPLITVTPSIWHNQPHGWHGWIRDGELWDA